jgi:hypothetical protein
LQQFLQIESLDAKYLHWETAAFLSCWPDLLLPSIAFAAPSIAQESKMKCEYLAPPYRFPLFSSSALCPDLADIMFSKSKAFDRILVSADDPVAFKNALLAMSRSVSAPEMSRSKNA